VSSGFDDKLNTLFLTGCLLQQLVTEWDIAPSDKVTPGTRLLNEAWNTIINSNMSTLGYATILLKLYLLPGIHIINDSSFTSLRDNSNAISVQHMPKTNDTLTKVILTSSTFITSWSNGPSLAFSGLYFDQFHMSISNSSSVTITNCNFDGSFLFNHASFDSGHL
jgi:hypothetical protein